MAAPTISDVEKDSDDQGEGAAYQLLVIGPEHTASTALPSRGTMLIGRDEGADIRVVDPLASRSHARLHVDSALEVEDLGSANGTMFRDERMVPARRYAFQPGDSMAIGSTLLVLRRAARGFTPRQIWPHAFFETRVIEECGRSERLKRSFAVVRLHVGEGADAAKTDSLLISALRSGDLLASYGPREYELLLVDTSRPQAIAQVQLMAEVLGRGGVKTRTGIACFPADGTAPQALVSLACAQVRGDEATTRAGPGQVLVNAAMKRLYASVDKVAPGMINVLIVGETGAGKELLAQAVHARSSRTKGPFICLNCAALSETLLETELFGHEKGAFTGAAGAKPGLLEAASGGTLFLDEIGEMSLNLQAKVLRAIETREVLRVGATRPRAVDVRFVAATNRDLEEEIIAKRFRQDLYFRLNGITMEIPPLRERADEIEPLARMFLDSVATQMAAPVPTVSPAALQRMMGYGWPGNIRELRNVTERAFLLSGGSTIEEEHLPLERMQRPQAAKSPPAEGPVATGGSLRDLERQAIIDALVRCAGNQTRAAELLGISRRTFCTRLKQYNISRPRGPE